MSDAIQSISPLDAAFGRVCLHAAFELPAASHRDAFERAGWWMIPRVQARLGTKLPRRARLRVARRAHLRR